MTDQGEQEAVDPRDEELTLLRRQVQLAEEAEAERTRAAERRGNRWLLLWGVVGALAIIALIAVPMINERRERDRNVCEFSQTMRGSTPSEARDYCR